MVDASYKPSCPLVTHRWVTLHTQDSIPPCNTQVDNTTHLFTHMATQLTVLNVETNPGQEVPLFGFIAIRNLSPPNRKRCVICNIKNIYLLLKCTYWIIHINLDFCYFI